MSKLTKNNFFAAGDDWSEEEMNTAAEIYARRRDVFERLGNSKKDNVLLAIEANNIIDKHGYNSPLYRDFINSTAVVAGWSNSNFRESALAAARGFNRLSGCEADKEFIWKQNPSLSALAKCEHLDNRLVFEFTKAVKAAKKFPTAADVETYNLKGRLPASKTERAEWKQEQSPYSASEPPGQTIDVVSTAVPDTSNTLASVSTEAVVEAETVIKLDETARSLMRLIDALDSLSADDVFARPELIEQLKPYRMQIEGLMSCIESTNRPSFRR